MEISLIYFHANMHEGIPRKSGSWHWFVGNLCVIKLVKTHILVVLMTCLATILTYESESFVTAVVIFLMQDSVELDQLNYIFLQR